MSLTGFDKEQLAEILEHFESLKSAGYAKISLESFGKKVQARLKKGVVFEDALLQVQDQLTAGSAIEVETISNALKQGGHVHVRGVTADVRIFDYTNKQKQKADKGASFQLFDSTGYTSVLVWGAERVEKYADLLVAGSKVLVAGYVQDKKVVKGVERGISINANTLDQTSFKLECPVADLKDVAEAVTKPKFEPHLVSMTFNLIKAMSTTHGRSSYLIEDLEGLCILHVADSTAPPKPGTYFAPQVLVNTHYKEITPTPNLSIGTRQQLESVTSLFSRRAEEIRDNANELKSGLVYNFRLMIKSCQMNMLVDKFSGKPYGLWTVELSDAEDRIYVLTEREEPIQDVENLVERTAELKYFKFVEANSKFKNSSKSFILKRTSFSEIRVF